MYYDITVIDMPAFEVSDRKMNTSKEDFLTYLVEEFGYTTEEAEVLVRASSISNYSLFAAKGDLYRRLEVTSFGLEETADIPAEPVDPKTDDENLP